MSHNNRPSNVTVRNLSVALKKLGISKDERDSFFKKAMGGNYDHVLQTCLETVEVI